MMQDLANILIPKNNAQVPYTFPCGCRFIMRFREIDAQQRIITGKDGWLHVEWLHCERHAEIVEGESK